MQWSGCFLFLFVLRKFCSWGKGNPLILVIIILFKYLKLKQSGSFVVLRAKSPRNRSNYWSQKCQMRSLTFNSDLRTHVLDISDAVYGSPLCLSYFISLLVLPFFFYEDFMIFFYEDENKIENELYKKRTRWC